MCRPLDADVPIQVSVVAETFPPEIGGAAMCIGRFVKALVDRRHFVQVVRPRQSPAGTTAPVADLECVLTRPLSVPLHPGLQLGWPASTRLRRLWSARTPDVIHIATEGPLGLSALTVALRLGIPVSTSFHTNFHRFSTYYGLGALRRLGLAYLRSFHNRAACTMVPTDQTCDELRGAGFRNLVVVPRGVDTRLFSPTKRREDLRRSWGAAPEDPVVLYVGRLAPEKNLPLAIQAFQAMRTAEPRARFVLVGEGPERPRLERRHPEFVFAGMRRDEDLAAHYASGDVFLFPSLTETFGNVTLEAMTSGLAVVAYDDAAAHQHVRHLESGLLAPPGRSEEFVSCAVRLVREPQLARRLRRGAARVAASIGWNEVERTFEGLLVALACRGRYP